MFSVVLTKPVTQKVLSSNIIEELKKPTIKSKTAVIEPIQNDLENFAKKYPLTILIVDDNPVNQILANRMVKKLGYESTTAENGVRAIEEINKSFYDVILMDIQMPEMDGVTTTRYIREHMEKQPVIIAVTANAIVGDKETYLQAGMNDYISKPFKFETFVAVLEKWAIHVLQNKRIVNDH